MNSPLLAYAYQSEAYNKMIYQSLLLAAIAGGFGGILSRLISDYFAQIRNRQIGNLLNRVKGGALNFVLYGGGAGLMVFVVYTSYYMPPAKAVNLVSIPTAILFPPISTVITELLSLLQGNENV